MTHGTVRATHLSRAMACVVAAMAVGTLTLSFATPAWAHVTVHPQTVPAGSSDVELTFRVPNERDDATTVGVQVFLPTDLPLLTVDILPVAGWTAKVITRTLAAPVTTDDGTVSRVVSDITWTATDGGIAPGQFEDFVIAAGRVPGQTGPAVFKTLQMYSSGEVVRWIQVTSPSDPQPDSPAPVLTITPGHSPVATAIPSTGDSTTETLAFAALAVSLIALSGTAVLFVRRRDPSGRPASAGGDDISPSGG